MSVVDRHDQAGRATSEDHFGLSKTYAPVRESVPLARHAVVEFARAAGASEEKLNAIALAASEAITNVVRYAYPADEGLIHVEVWLAKSELWLLIADDGCGLRAGRRDLGLGQGLALISAVSDDLSIHPRTSGGTEVWMRFDLDGSRDRTATRKNQARGSAASARRPAWPRFSTTR